VIQPSVINTSDNVTRSNWNNPGLAQLLL
jgi:hypothetical protein